LDENPTTEHSARKERLAGTGERARTAREFLHLIQKLWAKGQAGTESGYYCCRPDLRLGCVGSGLDRVRRNDGSAGVDCCHIDQ